MNMVTKMIKGSSIITKNTKNNFTE